MYGLVFEIVEEWVIEKQGIDVWHAIKDKARCQVQDQAFLRRSYYPDEELVDIVVAASDILGVQVPAILEAFGHYVIIHHYHNGYDELLRCQGSTLRQWLSNLNAMHDHVEKTFPGEKFSAPIFWCEDDEEVKGSILLHYYSLRGTLLVPMVVGIVEELATYEFKIDVKLNQLELQDEDGAQFTTWRISAIDERHQWKLSPQDKKLDMTVNFDNVKMPNKCPYSGRTFSNKTADTTSKMKCPQSSMSLDDDSDSSPDDLKPAANKDLLGLTLRNLQTIFPFHVLVDRDFVILQVGKSLPSLLNRNSKELTGQKIGDILEISRPVLGSAWDWKALSKLADQQFFLAPLSHQGATLHKKVSMADSAINFKGSMIKIAGDKVMFVLCPNVRNVGELNQMGLTMSDLPLISCQRDAVFLGEYITQEVEKAHELDKLRILYCTRDITDVIEAKKLADQASVQKTDFIAVMAHEIRTPLHQVIGCIELLGETTLNQEQSGFVNLMQNSAFSLMAIINDLLDYTKIEAGKMELESIPFEARGVCDGILADMEGKATEKGLRLEKSASADIPLKVVGDPNRLRQILLNLVNNAVKFTSQGTITLSVSRKAETDEKGRSILRFAVSDTGIGISSDHQKHIFVKYKQADPSVARHYGGSGLGLAICTSLVRLMGGSIGVESEVGKGSTFWFEAPFEKPADLKLKGEGKADPEDTVYGLSVLVAEDNKVNQKVVSAMLRRLGHKVTIAANGQIALDLLEQGDFDVILMDVQMPVLDGIEATKEIRRRGWTRPVIGLTASFQWSELNFYIDIGMDDCLGKPALLKDLRSAIFQTMETRTRDASKNANDMAPCA
jgi:signal transduction histidine kinase/ActR/RegA family two-component response regulator